MELKEIAVVSGKPGLFKIIKPAKNGVILEAMDGSLARFIASTSTKVSVLGEISIYTEDGNNVPLEQVFRDMFASFGKVLKVTSKSSDAEFRTFFEELVPAHDRQRVYVSDIKKVVVWYGLLLTAGFEELFSKKTEQSSEGVETAKEEPKKGKEAAKKEGKEPKAAVAKKETKPAAEKKAPSKKASK
jgi:hypothetical protein